ncbi:MAG: hypothetical protein HY365_01770 [Candidatus Aenigmarchaeota archaeon]|nr:hypothetical protein [Candidatus Aenigmarchaeota archaeon]
MNLRTVGKAVGGLFFPLFVSLFVASLSLVQITAAPMMEPLFTEVLSSQVAGNEELALSAIKAGCGSRASMDVQFSGGSLSVDCTLLKSATGIGGVAKAYFSALQSKTYQCSFIDCPPEILLSAQGASLLNTASLIFLALSVVFGLMLALSLQGFGIAKGIGASLTLVGLSYFTKYIPIDLPFDSMRVIIEIFASNFLIALYAGALLLAVGFICEMAMGKKNA